MAASGTQVQCKCGGIVRSLFLVLSSTLSLVGSGALTFSLWAYRKHELFPVWRDTFSFWMITQSIAVGCVVIATGLIGVVCLCKKSRVQLIAFTSMAGVSLIVTTSLLVVTYLSVQQRTDNGVDPGQFDYEMRSQQQFFRMITVVSFILMFLETVALVMGPIMMRATHHNSPPSYGSRQFNFSPPTSSSQV